jgi:hypothetical protein
MSARAADPIKDRIKIRAMEISKIARRLRKFFSAEKTTPDSSDLGI